MKKNELEAAMKRHGDTGGTLADYLGIARSTFSAKLNENGAEFTQGEIAAIKARYSLNAKELDTIFFSTKTDAIHKDKRRCLGSVIEGSQHG